MFSQHLYEVGVFLISCIHLTKWVQKEKIICPDYPLISSGKTSIQTGLTWTCTLQNHAFCFSLGIWFHSWGGTRDKHMSPGVPGLLWQGHLTFSHMGSWTQIHRHCWIGQLEVQNFLIGSLVLFLHNWRLYLIIYTPNE